MRRREFITLLGSAAVAWPLVARAQQGERMRRIGVLLPATADDTHIRSGSAPFYKACRIGLEHRAERADRHPLGDCKRRCRP